MNETRLPIFDPNAPVEDTNTASRLVLEGIELHWARLLDRESWFGLAHALRAGTEYDLTTSGFHVAVRTMLLGLTGERRRITWPATWQQHVKQAVLAWLSRESEFSYPPEGWRWCVERWLDRKLGYVRMDTEEVQVYQSACPHISAGGNHNPRLCIDYLTRMDRRGYSEVDYLVSRAHAYIMSAVQSGAETYERAHRLEEAGHQVIGLLQEALNVMNREGGSDG